MYAKIEIKGILEVKTGLHIGGSSAFAAIGAVDSPVIRDVITNLPIIPASSLKGKLRTLLARQYNKNPFAEHDKDEPRILRLFGIANKLDKNINECEKIRTRLLFRDLHLANMDELKQYGLNSATEVKFENTIKRTTAVANPRQIERVIRGTKFEVSIIYDAFNTDEIKEDMNLLADGMKLMEYDYLGGHGSRGYGKVKFSDIKLQTVIGQVDKSLLENCQKMFDDVLN